MRRVYELQNPQKWAGLKPSVILKIVNIKTERNRAGQKVDYEIVGEKVRMDANLLRIWKVEDGQKGRWDLVNVQVFFL